MFWRLRLNSDTSGFSSTRFANATRTAVLALSFLLLSKLKPSSSRCARCRCQVSLQTGTGRTRTVTQWAKAWFQEELTKISIQGDGGENIKVTSTSWVDGDVELGQRKSKCVSGSCVNTSQDDQSGGTLTG
ncbi:hypothetical protein JVT61DRAFT_2304 [Boletus reticuloceps]|uniref:Activator of Hsp90 ATPase AHSA1-like N-terminal domain-containing protein n=1 Tax=Boletus reticuloceps TaxID=495285 RepID=A0A8I3AAK7_9AGAM|nr:hypothetical protein JVT61DRAFT_2304 [Boletus reticuloceps]